MDFISTLDFNQEQIIEIIEESRTLKRGLNGPILQGKKIALLFEKPSLRTKMSFQIGISELGGYSVYMGPDEVGLGYRESIFDVATVLSSYVDCIVARVNSHQSLIELSQAASVPVVNALSDVEHPCQAMADILTIYEHKDMTQKNKLAFVGDGNNVSRSLCLLAAQMGMDFSIATPSGYGFDQNTIDKANAIANKTGSVLEFTNSPQISVKNADIVYTDAWTSMGQEIESAQRRKDFDGFTVDLELLNIANSDVIFMHDMPVHYGEEVPEGMLSSDASVAYKQAYNRLPAQQAILKKLLQD
jgi:ornithine carbamoyltransferase